MKFLLTLTIIGLLSSCSVLQRSNRLKIHEVNTLVQLSGYQFDYIDGSIQIMAKLPKDYEKYCSYKSGIKLPKLVIASRFKTYGPYKFSCRQSRDFMVAESYTNLAPGNYALSFFYESNTPRTELEGYIFYSPPHKKDQQDSEMDYAGAKELKEGVVKDDLNPALGNRTDWYKVDVKNFSNFKISVNANSNVEGAPVQLNTIKMYRMQKGNLVPKYNISNNKPINISLEGEYYLKLKSFKYAPSMNYSISLVKTKTSETKQSEEVMNLVDVPIVDVWPVGNGKTSLILGKGSSAGINVDNELKIYVSKKFLGLCKINQIDEKESQCILDKKIAYSKSLNARGSLK